MRAFQNLCVQIGTKSEFIDEMKRLPNMERKIEELQKLITKLQENLPK